MINRGEERWRWKIETTLSVTALTVALAGICLSAWDNWDNRRHRRLAVQPKVQFIYKFDQEGAGWGWMNAGLGPAEIMAFQASVRGKEAHTHLEVLSILGVEQRDSIMIGTVGRGTIVRAGDKGILIEAKSSPAREQLAKNLYDVKWRVCYCSIMGECWMAEEGIEQSVKSCDSYEHMSQMR
jgi:hypothetical protein